MSKISKSIVISEFLWLLFFAVVFLIYKGTPDYFYLIPLYSSVDLKDVFAFLGAGCILSITSTNEKNMQKKTTNMEAK